MLADIAHRDTSALGERTISNLSVMPGLVPGIHVFLFGIKDVDGRVKPGHDKEENSAFAEGGRRLLAPCHSAEAPPQVLFQQGMLGDAGSRNQINLV